MKTITFNPTTADDQQLVDLVEEITQNLQAGAVCDVDDYIARYPQYADRLRDWITVMTSMADLGHSLAVGPPSRGGPPSESGAARLAAPTPGLLGDFRILREIGRGGMGVVYEAEQISLGRRVALKVLPFAAMLDKQQLNRFKNEARAAGTLDHPNIVAIHSVGVDRGVHYYAMQLIEGQSLAQVIEQLREDQGTATRALKLSAPSPRRGGLGRGDETGTCFEPTIENPASSIDTAVGANQPTLPAPRSTLPAFSSRDYYRAIARLGIQAAEALDHAHASGILHRDIKPANLLVDDTGKLWITDFGLARMEQDAGMTMTGDLLGTLRYMSPEQALAKRIIVDHRSDIYSLGITLYELLTLQPAFAGDDRQELLRKIAFDEPRPPRQLSAHIPADLETIVLKAMRKTPEQRYATAHDLADDLGRFLDDQPIKAKPPTWRELAVKWSRHHPAAIWAAVLFLLATTILSAVSAGLITGAYNREAAQRELAEARLHAETEARERAKTESARAQAVSGFLQEMIFSPSGGARIKGSQYTVREMLDDYAAALGNQLADQPEVEAELRHAFAYSYAMLGLPERGEPHLKRAIELLRTRDSPQSVSLPDGLHNYGATLFLQRRYNEAEAPLREALQMYHQRGFRGSKPITSCKILQQALAAAGRHDEAERAIQEAWAEMQGYDELPAEFAQHPWADVAGNCCSFACYFARIGKHEEAAEFLRRATLAQQRLQMPLYSLGALLSVATARLRLGDEAGYRAACRVLADPPVRIINKDFDQAHEFNKQADEYNQTRLWVCFLGPDAVDDPSVLVKQAEEFAAHNSMLAPYIDLDLLGAAHFRAGHYEQAAQYFEQSIAQSPSERPPSHGPVHGTKLRLAMTKWQLREHDGARRLLREIQPEIDKYLETPTIVWLDTAATELLRREAEALIQPKETDQAVENKTRTSEKPNHPQLSTISPEP
jgi:serine/threonine protein kinase